MALITTVTARYPHLMVTAHHTALTAMATTVVIMDIMGDIARVLLPAQMMIILVMVTQAQVMLAMVTLVHIHRGITAVTMEAIHLMVITVTTEDTHLMAITVTTEAMTHLMATLF